MQLLKVMEKEIEKKDLDNLVSLVGLQCDNDTAIKGNMQ